MLLISTPRRPARQGEWTSGSAILFIVTLAAKGSVTLAARAAGMSRKSAYALKKRDPLFAASWDAATGAANRHAMTRPEGDTGRAAAQSTSSSHARQPMADPALLAAWRNRLAGLRFARESGHASRPAALAARARLP